MPGELEKHLILNSNILRTFDDARLVVVTYVEAKFGLIIRDAKPGETTPLVHSDPMDVDAVNSLSSYKGKVSTSPSGECFTCGGAHYERDCNARKGKSNQQSGKGKQNGKSWPKSESKGKGKENKNNPKENRKLSRERHIQTKAKALQKGLPGLEQPKSNEHSESHESEQTDSSENLCADILWCDDKWSHVERNDGWSSVGWHEGWDQTYDSSASSLSLRSFDLGAMSSPKRFEWARMNLETGASVNTCSQNFGPERSGDGRFYRTASGESIPDCGSWQFQGYDENALFLSLNGRLVGVHKVLCSAAEITCKGRQEFFLRHDGGYMIPIHSKFFQGLRTHFEKSVKWYGRNELIPVYLENIFNFYLSKEVKSTETNNLSQNSQQSGNEHGRAVRS